MNERGQKEIRLERYTGPDGEQELVLSGKEFGFYSVGNKEVRLRRI